MLADHIAVNAIWAASMSYSQKTPTNNQAEYQGLFTGLTAARALGLEHIHVVGDTYLILGQLWERRQPKNKKLLQKYIATRHLADMIGISSWSHLYREHNKVADLLANNAMDTMTSAQNKLPSRNNQLDGWTERMENDIMHWIEHMSALDTQSGSQ